MAKGFKISDTDQMWWVFRHETHDSEMADVVWQATLEDLELSIIGGANSRSPLGPRLVAAYSSEAEATAHGQRILDHRTRRS